MRTNFLHYWVAILSKQGRSPKEIHIGKVSAEGNTFDGVAILSKQGRSPKEINGKEGHKVEAKPKSQSFQNKAGPLKRTSTGILNAVLMSQSFQNKAGPLKSSL